MSRYLESEYKRCMFFLSVASRPVLSKRIKSNVIQGRLASSNVIECMQCKHIIENLSVCSRPLSIFSDRKIYIGLLKC